MLVSAQIGSGAGASALLLGGSFRGLSWSFRGTLIDASEVVRRLQVQVANDGAGATFDHASHTVFAIAVGADFLADPLDIPLFSGSFRLVPPQLQYQVAPNNGSSGLSGEAGSAPAD